MRGNPGPSQTFEISAKDPGTVYAFKSLILRKINLHGVETLGLWNSSKDPNTRAGTVPFCWVLEIENHNGIVYRALCFWDSLKIPGAFPGFLVSVKAPEISEFARAFWVSTIMNTQVFGILSFDPGVFSFCQNPSPETVTILKILYLLSTHRRPIVFKPEWVEIIFPLCPLLCVFQNS